MGCHPSAHARGYCDDVARAIGGTCQILEGCLEQEAEADRSTPEFEFQQERGRVFFGVGQRDTDGGVADKQFSPARKSVEYGNVDASSCPP